MADSLRIPSAMLDRAQAIIGITDRACHEHLDDEYGQIGRRLVARLARKRPSPLARGDAGIWAAGVAYAIGQIKMAWIVEVDGLLIDARTLPLELQDEARQRGLIPDLDRLRAAA